MSREPILDTEDDIVLPADRIDPTKERTIAQIDTPIDIPRPALTGASVGEKSTQPSDLSVVQIDTKELRSVIGGPSEDVGLTVDEARI
jgi:hypothetical protein